MERYLNIIQRSLELLGTMEEGIVYMQDKVQTGEYEASILIMQDVLVAYSVVERSLSPVFENLSSNEIEKLGSKLRGALQQLIFVYEQKMWGEVESTLSHVFVPCYKAWKQEVEKRLQLYTIS